MCADRRLWSLLAGRSPLHVLVYSSIFASRDARDKGLWNVSEAHFPQHHPRCRDRRSEMPTKLGCSRLGPILAAFDEFISSEPMDDRHR